MAALDIRHPAVAGNIGDGLYTGPLEVFPDQPDLTGQVEIAQDVERMF